MIIEYLALTLPGADGQAGQTINPPASIPKGGLTTLNTVISNGMNLVLIFGVILTLLVLVWAGIQWASSGGDKAKIQAARNRITWALIGVVLLFLSFMIINIVAYFFNIKFN